MRLETPHGVLRRLDGRHGPRWYLEVPGCPDGKLELLDDRQLRGELSVNHAAVCGCGYHETHDFAEEAVRHMSLDQFARIKALRENAGVDVPPSTGGAPRVGTAADLYQTDNDYGDAGGAPDAQG